MFEAEFSKLEQLIQKLISENQQLTAQVQQLGQKEQQLQQELKKVSISWKPYSCMRWNRMIKSSGRSKNYSN